MCLQFGTSESDFGQSISLFWFCKCVGVMDCYVQDWGSIPGSVTTKKFNRHFPQDKEVRLLEVVAKISSLNWEFCGFVVCRIPLYQ